MPPLPLFAGNWIFAFVSIGGHIRISFRLSKCSYLSVPLPIQRYNANLVLLLDLVLLPFCFPWMISQTKSFESLLNHGCHATGLVDGCIPSVCVCRVDTKKTWWKQCMHIHVSSAFPSCVFHPFQISSWSSSASKREGSSIDLQAQASGNKGENEGEFLYEKQRRWYDDGYTALCNNLTLCRKGVICQIKGAQLL